MGLGHATTEPPFAVAGRPHVEREPVLVGNHRLRMLRSHSKETSHERPLLIAHAEKRKHHRISTTDGDSRCAGLEEVRKLSRVFLERTLVFEQNLAYAAKYTNRAFGTRVLSFRGYFEPDVLLQLDHARQIIDAVVLLPHDLRRRTIHRCLQIDP